MFLSSASLVMWHGRYWLAVVETNNTVSIVQGPDQIAMTAPVTTMSTP